MDKELELSRFINYDGVSCYMISILHILQHLPIFNYYLRNMFQDKDKLKGSIFNELSRLIKKSYKNSVVEISPNKFKKTIGKFDPMWNEIEQQDSQEFYTFLISKLEEECGTKLELNSLQIQDRKSVV